MRSSDWSSDVCSSDLGGDGHAVLTLPGFLATNNSTVPMRGLLRSLGYDAHGWDSGRNLRVDNGLVHRLESQIARLNDASGGKILLVGWSLGGTIAQRLAQLRHRQRSGREREGTYGE